MLSTIYPEHEWHPWKLPTVPRGWWASRSNQEMFFEWLCAELNITSPDDWYQVSSITVQQYGGRSLLQMFNDDLVTMLQHFYPNHEWVPWKFTKLNRFETEESKREYAEWLFKELKLNSLEDWYNVSRTSIIKLPGKSVFFAGYHLRFLANISFFSWLFLVTTIWRFCGQSCINTISGTQLGNYAVQTHPKILG